MEFRKTPVLLFLLSLMAGCASMRPAVFNRAFSDDVEAAKRLVSTGHLKQAIDELTLLIDMDPKNIEARSLRGAAYQGLEEFDLAVKDFEEAVRIDPSNPKVHYNLGMIFAYKLHDPRRALEHFDRFLSLAPGHDRAYAVAKVMCSIDTSQAGSPIPSYLAGKSYEEEGKIEEAMRSYREAIEKRPTCAPCHYSLGRLLILKKKTGEGQSHLARAKLFDPNSSQQDFETEGVPSEEKNSSGGSL